MISTIQGWSEPSSKHNLQQPAQAPANPAGAGSAPTEVPQNLSFYPARDSLCSTGLSPPGVVFSTQHESREMRLTKPKESTPKLLAAALRGKHFPLEAAKETEKHSRAQSAP